MFGQNQIPDKTLAAQVTQRLARAGLSALRPTIRNGEVTMVGTLKYEAQRRPAMSTASSIAGVRSVIDRMVVNVVKKT